MKKSVYILGGSQTDFQRNWTKEGKNFIAMFNEVVKDGLQSVQIEYAEIRELAAKKSIGVFVGNFNAQQYVHKGHLDPFYYVDKSFNGIPAARYEAACASGSVAIDAASAKIRAGDIEVAIVIGFEIMKSVSSKAGGDFLGTAAYYETEAKGVSFPFPKLFGRLADEMLVKYNVREKRLSVSKFQ
jgi:acetyl-CoA C-acetyltransferase